MRELSLTGPECDFFINHTLDNLDKLKANADAPGFIYPSMLHLIQHTLEQDMHHPESRCTEGISLLSKITKFLEEDDQILRDSLLYMKQMNPERLPDHPQCDWTIENFRDLARKYQYQGSEGHLQQYWERNK